jgi:pimeloyl-ACP methyl ester carboxylesterase
MDRARAPLTPHPAGFGPTLRYRVYVPHQPASGPPVVVLHGNGRDGGRTFRAFLPAAMEAGVPLLAPTFPRDRFPRYQVLAGVSGPLAAARALLATLDDAAADLGLAVGQVDLVGYSGGAQFVHRFAMLEPARVRRAVVAAAGWYTYLDPDRPFPDGAGAGADSMGWAMKIDSALQVPMLVLVGERDFERDAAMRTDPQLDYRQGLDRRDRARRWTAHLEAAARARGLPVAASVELLPGCGHSFPALVERGGLVRRTFAFLREPERASGPAHPRCEGGRCEA